MAVVQEGGPLAGSGRKEDIGAAIQYAINNAGALTTAVRVIVGFFASLFAKKRVGLLSDTRCPFCGR
jgi:hypothetical protein